MKKLAVFGYSDKRSLTYPLMRVLSFMGNVKVITDDYTILRFSENGEKEFKVNQIDFEVKRELSKADYEKDYDTTLYEYVLFISKDNVPYEGIKLDKVILVRGIERPYVELEKLELMELTLDDKFIQVYMTNMKVPKGSINIAPSEKMVKYLTECEEKRWFVKMNESQQVATLKELFGKELKLDKSALIKLLKREW